MSKRGLCEWKFVVDHITKDGNDEDYPIYQLETECAMELCDFMQEYSGLHRTVEDFIVESQFTFCPNCGRRIRYESEECQWHEVAGTIFEAYEPQFKTECGELYAMTELKNANYCPHCGRKRAMV